MADPHDDDRPRRDDKVPETWRGYLGEERQGQKPREDELSPEEREFLERNLRPTAGDERAEGPRGTQEPAPRVSRAEGVSFAGLIPFFLALFLVVVAAFAFGHQYFKPKPYDTSAFAPPDKTIEVVAREFFRASGTGVSSPDLFVDDVQVAQMGLRHKLPAFGRPLAQRYPTSLGALKGGKYQVVDPTPVELPLSDAAAYLDYNRTDLTTNAQSVERLWFGRTPEGWRVVGFE